MSKEYNIEAVISIDIDFDIPADSIEDARKKATEILSRYYRLDVEGAYHEDSKLDLNVNDYE